VKFRYSVAWVSASVVFALAACGGGGSKPIVPKAGADAGAEGGSIFATTPPPSGLPPMAQMPPAGVIGSKKAKKRADAALASCTGASSPAAKDPLDFVKRTGEACAAASKMKPLGPPIRGQQADKDAHQEHRVRVEANKCYRVYFATDEAVKDAVLVVRDSAGDIVAESPAAAVPEDGTMCFSVADELTLLVAIGRGKGAYAAQMWGE
jgi:hypothetical protein